MKVAITVRVSPCTSVTVSVQLGVAAPVPVLAVVQVTVRLCPDTRLSGAWTVSGTRSGWVVTKLPPEAVLLVSRPPSATSAPLSAVAARREGPSGSAGRVMAAVTV